MEDYALDIIVGKGPSARNIRFSLKKFTLIGATTRAGMIANPLRDRFGIICRLEMYTPDELKDIVLRSARTLGIAIEDEAAAEVAKRSRGTPRIANRLLKRVRDFSTINNNPAVTIADAKYALSKMEVVRIFCVVKAQRLCFSVNAYFIVNRRVVGFKSKRKVFCADSVVDSIFKLLFCKLGRRFGFVRFRTFVARG